MLVEHMPGCAKAHKNGTGVAVGKNLASTVKDAPSGNHIVFIYVTRMVRRDNARWTPSILLLNAGYDVL